MLVSEFKFRKPKKEAFFILYDKTIPQPQKKEYDFSPIYKNPFISPRINPNN